MINRYDKMKFEELKELYLDRGLNEDIFDRDNREAMRLVMIAYLIGDDLEANSSKIIKTFSEQYQICSELEARA